jgi:hypothetical protein
MRRALFVLSALTALCFGAATGCGSTTPASNPSSSASGAAQFTVYKNAKFGFSLVYPARWTRTVSVSASASPQTGERLLAMTLIDPQGAEVQGGQLADGESVEVYQLDRAVKPGVRYTSVAMRVMGGSLLPRLQSLEVKAKPKEVSVHGDPGWSVAYTYALHGHSMLALSVLVLKHRYAYWVTGQSTAETWSAMWPRLRISLGTFRVR